MEFIVRSKASGEIYGCNTTRGVALFFLGKDIDEWEVFIRFRNLSRSGADLEDNLNKEIKS